MLGMAPATHQNIIRALTGLGYERDLVFTVIDRGIDRKWWGWSGEGVGKLSSTPKVAAFQPFATWLTEDGYARVATRLKKNEREREEVYQEFGGNPRAMASTIWRLRQMLAEAEKRNGTDD